MPTLAVARDYLFKLIGKTYTQEDFEKLCFEFGVELDDVTSEREMVMRELTSADGTPSDLRCCAGQRQCPLASGHCPDLLAVDGTVRAAREGVTGA